MKLFVERFLASVQCSSVTEDASDEIRDETIYEILNATHAFFGVSILGGSRLPTFQIGSAEIGIEFCQVRSSIVDPISLCLSGGKNDQARPVFFFRPLIRR